MTFDYQAQRMLLYGGGQYLNDPRVYDAWTWDGTNWQLAAGSSQPAFQSGWAMTSAPNQGVFLIYPGNTITTINGNRRALLATYRWTGTGWITASAEGPAERGWPGFTYDPNLGAFLLFGGVNGQGWGCGWGPTDMWTWDGQNWTQLNPSGTRPCAGGGSMTYDSARKLVVWVGEDGTWAWDGKQWAQRATAAQSPPFGNWATLTYDPAHQQVLLTGMLSGDGFGHTYVWDGAAWTTA